MAEIAMFAGSKAPLIESLVYILPSPLQIPAVFTFITNLIVFCVRALLCALEYGMALIPTGEVYSPVNF